LRHPVDRLCRRTIVQRAFAKKLLRFAHQNLLGLRALDPERL